MTSFEGVLTVNKIDISIVINSRGFRFLAIKLQYIDELYNSLGTIFNIDF
jgi:hypothetical protein